MRAKPFADAEPADVRWSIADVERETGLGKDTLRVWERRYGFPAPTRDAHGERVYPESQLQRLRLIKRLIDAGHRPGKIVPLPLEALQQQLDKIPAPAAVMTNPLLDQTPWITWLQQDRAELIQQTLQQHILRHGLGQVVDDLVAPLCGLVGSAWVKGDISVYQEHLLSETLQSVLREAIASVDAAGRHTMQAPRVLLTTTPNELHGLGLLMATCHLALAGCERYFLGTSTPISDIIQGVQRLHIDVLALSFSAHTSRNDLLDHLQLLRQQLPSSVEIWAGGAATLSYRQSLPDDIHVLTDPRAAATQALMWRQRRASVSN